MDTFTLSNGVVIPGIGFGPGIMGYTPNVYKAVANSLPVRVWRRFVGRPLARRRYVRAIVSALKTGFRLIDYSAAYGDGGAIADAMGLAAVPREQVFLTGRISNGAQFHGADAVRKEIRRILAEYRTDYVDLLMLHWPVPEHFGETWRIICEAYDSGLTRSIGVANCHPHHLTVLERCGLRPMVNQIEVHPLFTQKPLVSYCQERDILVEAYTPIARFDDRLMRLPTLKRIAQAHGRTPTQVVLRWHIQNGVVPVVRSLNPGRQRENFGVSGFELSDSEMRTIDGFNINSRLRYHPDNCDFTIL